MQNWSERNKTLGYKIMGVDRSQRIEKKNIVYMVCFRNGCLEHTNINIFILPLL